MQLNATPPAFIKDAITNLDWAHEMVGTVISEGPEYIELDDVAAGSTDARRAADLLAAGGPVDGFDVAGAADAARAVAQLLDQAHGVLATATDRSGVGPQLIELGERAEEFIHAAYQALGTDRD